MKYEVTVRFVVDGDDEKVAGQWALHQVEQLIGGKACLVDVRVGENRGELLTAAIKELGFDLWSTGGGCEAWRLEVGDHFVYLTDADGSGARDLCSEDTLWLGYYEKDQDHSDEMILREGDWSELKPMILEFKSGEWLTKRQKGQLKTLAEFRHERKFVTKDKEWCDQYSIGNESQRVVEYPGDCFITVEDDQQYWLVIGNQEWTSPNLAWLEFQLYKEWYLREIAA